MTTLRTARDGDHARVVAVIDAWWSGRPVRALLQPLFLQHFAGSSLVAEEADGTLAGFLIGFRSADRPEEAYVHFLGVAPDARGRGLGRSLHDRFAAEQASAGVRLVRCVTGRVNTASVAFHTAIGFRVDGVDAGADPEGLVHLSRPTGAQAPRPRVDERPTDSPWPPVRWPPAPGTVLRGRVVELTPTDPAADAAALFAALDDDRVWAHVAGRPASVAGMRALCATKAADPAWFPWTVRLRVAVGGLPAGTVAGTTSYLEVAPADARLEIGSTTYAPAVWGTAVNPECKLLLLDHAFRAAGFGRVQLKTDIRNARSQRAIEGLGARFEGVLRRYQRRADGTVRDTVLYAVTAEDWPRVQDLLTARLAARRPAEGRIG